MRYLRPIIVAELFPGERAALLQLLTTLTDEQWALPTVCAGWSVHDVALHLFGDDIGIISRRRDDWQEPSLPTRLSLSQWATLVAYINRRNEMWVQATRRISSRLLCELLHLTGEPIAQYFAQLDQFAIGVPVHWASPDPAPVWLDTAREYTERWLHQQQIRDAVGQPGLKEKRFFHPVLDTFVRALPHTYKDFPIANTPVLKFVVTGEAGDVWYLVGEANRWSLSQGVELRPRV